MTDAFERSPYIAATTAPLHPLPLAEQIDVEALHGQIVYEQDSDGERNWSDWLRFSRQAWSMTELALALSPGEEAADYLEDADILAERAAFDNPIESSADLEAAFMAGSLYAALPGFYTRQESGRLALSRRERANERTQLARASVRVLENLRHSQNPRDISAKIALQLLMRRAKVQYFPGSARESQNQNPEYASLSHDGYIIDDPDIKLPIKVSAVYRPEHSDSRILHLPYIATAKRGLTRAASSADARGRTGEDLLSILVNEALGERLEGVPARWAYRTTDLILERIDGFRTARQEDPNTPQ